jgi:hypothetical protein
VCEVAQSLQLVSFKVRLVSESCLPTVLAGSKFHQLQVAPSPSILPNIYPFRQSTRPKKKSLGWVFVEPLVGALLPVSVCFHLFPWLLWGFLAVLPNEFLLLDSEAPALFPVYPLSWFPLGAPGSLPGSVLIRLEYSPVMRFRQYQRSQVAAAHFIPVFLVT